MGKHLNEDLEAPNPGIGHCAQKLTWVVPWDAHWY